MVLTEKQRADLHAAVLEYLESMDFSETAKSFASEANLGETQASSKGSIALLEKKWTSVVRLQRKVLELEGKVKELEAEKRLGVTSSASGTFRAATESYLIKTNSLRRFSGHRAPVTCVAFHPRFNIVVSTSEDATAKVWDFETGEFERTLKGHTNAVQEACFNDDGSLLATCSSDLSIKLWDFSPSGSYECVKTLMGHDHNVSGVAFLAGSSQLVSCSRDKTLKVWDVGTGFCVRTLQGHLDWVRKVAVHKATNSVASCSNDHSVIVWNLAITSGDNIQHTLRGHEHVVECVAFSSSQADRALGASTSSSSGAAPAENGGDAGVLEENQVSNAVQDPVPKGKRTGGLHLVSGSRDRSIRIWHVASGACLFTLQGHDNWVRALAFQPQGKYLISVSEDKSIRMWDLAQQKSVRTISNAHAHFITSLAVHPTLALVATGSVDQDVATWGAAIN